MEVARSKDYGIPLARNYERNFCSHTINGSAQHEPVSPAAAQPYIISGQTWPSLCQVQFSNDNHSDAEPNEQTSRPLVKQVTDEGGES
jgi:hypothetical protein